MARQHREEGYTSSKMENINTQQETKSAGHKELKKAKLKPPYEMALEIHK